jgi:ribulose-bisphosphate carboxylase large chain
MKAVSSLRLVDVRWPPSLVSSFPGPQFGRDGIRRFMKVKKRPLTASVPKPKLGLTYEEHARYGYEAWLGGLDLLKDDENLTNQGFNSFERRARLCFRYRDKAEKETGERKSYLINITADTSEMERRAKLVHSLGGEYVMVDICTTGWGALETVRSFCKDLGLAIHAHRAFHATFTRSRRHGMSMAVLAETARLIGVDQLHIGTVIGKLVGSKSEVLGLQDKIVSRISRRGEFSFSQDWGGLRPVFPVSSGGLHVGIVGALMSLLGTDIVIQVGGGIWGHPSGGRSGAKALRDAIDAFTQGVDLESYATRSRELREALEKWGTRSYR